PIDETVAAIDQPIAKHIEEGPSHRARADRIHGEALAIPVASAAHHLLLANDPSLVLVLPLPDPLDEPFTTEVVPRLPFDLEEPLLDDRLRGDARVIRPRLPERVRSAHAMPAREEI